MQSRLLSHFLACLNLDEIKVVCVCVCCAGEYDKDDIFEVAIIEPVRLW